MRAHNPILAATLLLTAFSPIYISGYAQEQIQSSDTEVICMAESPIDGSMWMATSNNGLYRLGKNGSRLHFGAEGGKLATNALNYICFDSRGTLWAIGSDGSITSYNPEKGFSVIPLINEQISKSIYMPKEDNILIASVTKYYYFDTNSENIKSESKLPFKPVNIKLASDSSFVWIFGEKQVVKLSGDGTLAEWDAVGDVSESIPLEFETYTEQGTSRTWLWILIAASFVIVCVVIILLARGKKSPAYHTIDAEKNASDEVLIEREHEYVNNTPKETKKAPARVENDQENDSSSVTKSEPVNMDFTNLVTALIAEHYKEPDFDVDEIAALTGLSRIHVNRKLKAEGSPSPSVLIKERRMEIAKLFLLRSEIPMAQIASECGFRSASYFTTAFKDYTGLTPSEFVAQNRL